MLSQPIDDQVLLEAAIHDDDVERRLRRERRFHLDLTRDGDEIELTVEQALHLNQFANVGAHAEDSRGRAFGMPCGSRHGQAGERDVRCLSPRRSLHQLQAWSQLVTLKRLPHQNARSSVRLPMWRRPLAVLKAKRSHRSAFPRKRESFASSTRHSRESGNPFASSTRHSRESGNPFAS